MNRILLWATSALAVAGVLVTPAAAEFSSSFYQPALQHATAASDASVADQTGMTITSVSIGDQSATRDSVDQDAYAEPPTVGYMGDEDLYDTDYGCKGGKGGSWGCCLPRWRFTVDGLALRREHMDSVPLLVDGNSVLFDSDDIDLGHRGGLRLAASRQIDCRHDIEFEFFYVDQWSDSESATEPSSQFTVYGASFGTSPIELGYGTDLYSFELNWRRAWGAGRIKSLIGFRLMELGENMTVSDAASPPLLFDGDIDNHLIGFQVGLEGIIWQSCRWQIEGGCKAGIYSNSADFAAKFPQAGSAAVFDAAGDYTTFSGELWLGANYSITQCLALRVGYQAQWIEGVAVLPEQLDDLAVPILGDLDMGGSPFYHGLYVGTQLDW